MDLTPTWIGHIFRLVHQLKCLSKELSEEMYIWCSTMDVYYFKFKLSEFDFKQQKTGLFFYGFTILKYLNCAGRNCSTATRLFNILSAYIECTCLVTKARIVFGNVGAIATQPHRQSERLCADVSSTLCFEDFIYVLCIFCGSWSAPRSGCYFTSVHSISSSAFMQMNLRCM